MGLGKVGVDASVLRLTSPLELPSHKYVKFIKNLEFERNYFKFHFPQEILQKYDDYIPWYRVDKMI